MRAAGHLENCEGVSVTRRWLKSEFQLGASLALERGDGKAAVSLGAARTGWRAHAAVVIEHGGVREHVVHIGDAKRRTCRVGMCVITRERTAARGCERCLVPGAAINRRSILMTMPPIYRLVPMLVALAFPLGFRAMAFQRLHNCPRFGCAFRDGITVRRRGLR